MKSNNEVTLRFILRAFRHRNYRLFFSGQGASLVGTWMQQIAMGWLAYDLSNSAFVLGLIAFVGQIPSLLVTPVAGVFIDRWHRHHLLIILQTLSMVQAFVLAALTLTGLVTVKQLVGLSVFLGIVNAFEVPCRQSFVIDMLERKEDLPNALALNSFMFNGARLVGPTIAGLLIRWTGEGICFLLNGISFFFVVAALLAMKIPRRERPDEYVQFTQGLREGFDYALRFTPIRYVLLLLAVVSIAGLPYLVLMPVFARDILHGGPQTLGFLMGASGVGALVGALYLASRKNILGLGKVIGAAPFVLGCALIAFSLSRSAALSMGLMLFVGFGAILTFVSSNTLIQSIVDEDKRGRVMSFFVMAFLGLAPLGSFLAGALATRIGAPFTLLIGGVVCVAGSLLFFSRLPRIRQVMRPLYVEMGLVRTIPTATE